MDSTRLNITRLQTIALKCNEDGLFARGQLVV
uniref:Uncharacterized protein n=1 Tax=Anopheles arabiensis TaxID=7173 RepID=A0A182IGW2_ANOAR